MQLVGMLDSPYVRRVAVSMKFMKINFHNEALSVFGDFERFRMINPCVKAPTLIVEDGTVLMDSGVILHYLDRLTQPELRLDPTEPKLFQRAQRITGLALIAMEKTVQWVYEARLRPEDRHFHSWIERVREQLFATFRLLEAEIAEADLWLCGPRPLQADISSAVVWAFSKLYFADDIADHDFPKLAALSVRAEKLPQFTSCPIIG